MSTTSHLAGAAGVQAGGGKLPQPYANPYLAGIGLGLVLLAAFVIMGRGLGASSAFTAIVTAMVGVYYLSALGIVDLSLVYLTPTYLVPQIVGGLILGVGFVVGGYCPGTSCVAASTGKYDALAYPGGILAGSFLFAEAYPLVGDFYYATAMGGITLAQQFHMSYGLLVLAVILMAVGGFAGATWVERWIATRKGVRS